MVKLALVTGARGFIGSHLTEKLVTEGYRVRTFLDYNSWAGRESPPSRDNDIAASVEAVTGDIREFQSVRRALDECEVVFHLASLTGVPYSYTSPRSYVETNVGGTLNVLEAARETGRCRVVYVSSSEIYGPAISLPVDENHPLRPQSPYAATKCSADQMALSYHSSFQLPVVVVRPFNTYGPRQSTRAVIPSTIAQIAAGKTKIRLGALHPTRDFTYVSDTVSAFLAAARQTDAVGEALNIGSNFEVSIRDLVALIAEVMNTAIEIESDEMRMRPNSEKDDRIRANNCKALELLNWTPEYAGKAGLRLGLARTAEWFLKNLPAKDTRHTRYHV